MATSFQRLLKGLNVLNRYSGITDAFSLQMPNDHSGRSYICVVSVPRTVIPDARDLDALKRLGWDDQQDGVLGRCFTLSPAP